MECAACFILFVHGVMSNKVVNPLCVWNCMCDVRMLPYTLYLFACNWLIFPAPSVEEVCLSLIHVFCSIELTNPVYEGLFFQYHI